MSRVLLCLMVNSKNDVTYPIYYIITNLIFIAEGTIHKNSDDYE